MRRLDWRLIGLVAHAAIAATYDGKVAPSPVIG